MSWTVTNIYHLTNPTGIQQPSKDQRVPVTNAVIVVVSLFEGC